MENVETGTGRTCSQLRKA